MTIPLSALGASLDVTDAANPKLIIPFNGVNSVSGWGIAPTNASNNLESWLIAILKAINAYNEANSTNATINLVVNRPFKGVATRNNQSKIVHTYQALTYSSDASPEFPDPDSF